MAFGKDKNLKVKRTYKDFINDLSTIDSNLWFPRVTQKESLKFLLETKRDISINKLIALRDNTIQNRRLASIELECTNRELDVAMAKSIDVIIGMILEDPKDLILFKEGLALNGECYAENGQKKVVSYYDQRPWIMILRILEMVEFKR